MLLPMSRSSERHLHRCIRNVRLRVGGNTLNARPHFYVSVRESNLIETGITPNSRIISTANSDIESYAVALRI